jgi:hypothetical protein
MPRFRRSLVNGLIVLVALSAAARADPRPSKPNPIVEARVRLGNRPPGVELELVITDAKLLKSLVEEPLAAAKPTSRSDSISLGFVRFRRKDGTEGGFNLFVPWGRTGYDGSELTTDLTGLRKAFRDKVEEQLNYAK